MPWSGSSFSRTNGTNNGNDVWAQDKAAGTKITTQRHDAHDQDIADAINACLKKDGANAATADLNLGGYKLSSVADGTADDDAATVRQLPAEASDVDLQAGTDSAKKVTSRRLYTANAPKTIAYTSTITLDLKASRAFSIDPLTGNLTLANPTNIIPGQSGKIRLQQDATGSRTLALGSYWKRPNGTLVLSTAANAVDHLWYYAESATEIVLTTTQAHS